jgi:hypothetical protein
MKGQASKGANAVEMNQDQSCRTEPAQLELHMRQYKTAKIVLFFYAIRKLVEILMNKLIFL